MTDVKKVIALNRLRAQIWMKRFLRHRNNTIWNWRSGLKIRIYRLQRRQRNPLKTHPITTGLLWQKSWMGSTSGYVRHANWGTKTWRRSICSDVKSFFQRGCRHMLFHRNGSMIITGRRRHRSGIWSERKSSDVSSGLTSASVEARSGNIVWKQSRI